MDFRALPLNEAKALAETMPVQTPGSGSDGVTVFTIFCQSLQLLGSSSHKGERGQLSDGTA
jgi:hypothetical protein